MAFMYFHVTEQSYQSEASASQNILVFRGRVSLQSSCLALVKIRAWGPFLVAPEKFSGPDSHNKNLKPYVYRAVLFTQF